MTEMKTISFSYQLSKNTHIQLVINVTIHTTEQDMKCMYNVTLWCAQTFASWPHLRWLYHLIQWSHNFIVQSLYILLLLLFGYAV